MSVIIIEGPNGTGKTTLGLKLSDALHFGYYRRRVMFRMEHEIVCNLHMEECVLDRCWMTDVVYSEVKGRTPAFGRNTLYRFGLLAEKFCRMYIKLGCGNLGHAPELIEGVNDQHRLQVEFSKPHWSEPTPVHFMDARPSDSRVDELVELLKGHAGPAYTKGLGSMSPCPVLADQRWELNELIDLLFLCGVRPRAVHIMEKDEDLDQALEFFKPTVTVFAPSSGPIRGFHIEHVRERFIEAGLPCRPLEETHVKC